MISCYSDHFSFKVILRGMPSTGRQTNDKETIWNLNKLGGWDKYKNKTDEASNQVIDIIENENYSIEEVMEKVQKVEESGQGRVGQIFKMKEIAGGPRKSGMEPHAIEDPNTKELLVANNDIKRATLEYCANNLRNKEPDPEVEDLVELN